MPTLNDWADAIAMRIADEWNSDADREDRILLESVLSDVLRTNPAGARKLIGTLVIEEDYFDPLD
ncbi:MAG: hypothetical protein L3J82_04505 [Planctomycetes bacterium]|nr:hypothetical protein [Planctomycetota bacterium]